MTINTNTAGQALRLLQPGIRPEANVAAMPLTAVCAKPLSAIALWQIAFCNRLFRFKNLLVVEVHEDSGGFTHECPELQMIAYGVTEDQSLREFEIEFGLAWDAIAGESDEALTLDAQELKQKLLNLVASVKDCS